MQGLFYKRRKSHFETDATKMQELLLERYKSDTKETQERFRNFSMRQLRHARRMQELHVFQERFVKI